MYSDFRGIYEKDAVLMYCLLNLAEDETYIFYNRIKPAISDTREKNRIINWVENQISLFNLTDKRILRNAHSHMDFETNNETRIITFPSSNNEPDEHMSFEEIRQLCEEMSALELSFRLTTVILAKNDWQGVHRMLYRPDS